MAWSGRAGRGRAWRLSPAMSASSHPFDRRSVPAKFQPRQSVLPHRAVRRPALGEVVGRGARVFPARGGSCFSLRRRHSRGADSAGRIFGSGDRNPRLSHRRASVGRIYARFVAPAVFPARHRLSDSRQQRQPDQCDFGQWVCFSGQLVCALARELANRRTYATREDSARPLRLLVCKCPWIIDRFFSPRMSFSEG